MPGEEGFIREILESPDDESLRLIYADWLEERGDPRGEFIRLQCALAKMPMTLGDRAGLEARAEALLERYEREWMQPLRALGVQRWHFRRGLVESVAMGAFAFLRNAEALFRLAPVREVRFGTLDYLLPRLVQCPHLARVSALNLDSHGSQVGDAGVQALADSSHPTRVTALSLTNDHITDEGARALAGSAALARLRVLDLGHNSIGPAGAEALLSSGRLPALASLRLSPTDRDEWELLRARYGQRIIRESTWPYPCD